MVSKMVEIGMPIALAFSMSTEIWYWGTEVENMFCTPASSGRRAAACTTRSAASARLAREPPVRSCR